MKIDDYNAAKALTEKLIAVPNLVRYVFKATKLAKQDLGVPQLLRKRYKENLPISVKV